VECQLLNGSLFGNWWLTGGKREISRIGTLGIYWVVAVIFANGNTAVFQGGGAGKDKRYEFVLCDGGSETGMGGGMGELWEDSGASVRRKMEGRIYMGGEYII